MQEIVQATMKARARTGRKIATRVKKGLLQIIEVKEGKKGKYQITELSGWMPIADLVNALNEVV